VVRVCRIPEKVAGDEHNLVCESVDFGLVGGFERAELVVPIVFKAVVGRVSVVFGRFFSKEGIGDGVLRLGLAEATFGRRRGDLGEWMWR